MLERLAVIWSRASNWPGCPKFRQGGRDLKAVEDQLDALLAAYIAAHWWYWGRERNDVLEIRSAAISSCRIA